LNRKIVFLTGTRADFGKLKPLINKVEASDDFECHIFVTGMHLLKKYGETIIEVKKQGYKNIYPYNNQSANTDMDIVLSNTILGFSNYVKELKPDMIIIHGDRGEALACAIVGAINNILVAHVEGGEISGTIDELIRHAVTKLSHVHFVANSEAKKRVIQLGELEESVYIIGSPDIDIMKSGDLPSLESVKEHYEIPFAEYGIFCYHPVTTEIETLKDSISGVVEALERSERQFVIIYPNNDTGSDIIINALTTLENHANFRILRSMRFESYLTLLKHARLIVGNSSAGIREATIYSIPTVNIGSRQKNRSANKDIVNVGHSVGEVMAGIERAMDLKLEPVNEFGTGDSANAFYSILQSEKLWGIERQKQFKDFQ
jgi:UDP-N-acetylglucosamine 2-epimerase (hydrolysing)